MKIGVDRTDTLVDEKDVRDFESADLRNLALVKVHAGTHLSELPNSIRLIWKFFALLVTTSMVWSCSSSLI